MKNPFNYFKVIRDPEYFKGRKEEIEDIRSRLENFHNISIVGPRKIGKTSLLLNLEHFLGQYLPNVYFIYFSFEGNNATTIPDLYNLLIIEATKKIKGRSHGYKKVDDFSGFKDFIGGITNTKKGIIYLFDEFESCRDELLPPLRDIGNKNPLVSIITATKKIYLR